MRGTARACVGVLVLGATWIAGAPSSALAAKPPTPGSIREAHLSRLDERLATSQDSLREQCRFESDIATAPPHGLVALTFDDGPTSEHTRAILEILARAQVPATFFLIGENAERHPELVDAILTAGPHLIGGHSWSHPNFHDLTPEAQAEEIVIGNASLPSGLRPTVFRYPYGNSSCASNALLHDLGYRIVGWHFDSCDWAFDRTGTVDPKEAISCGVASQYRSDCVGQVAATVRARRGGIVLLHEIHDITPAKLWDLIEEIRRDGFTFVRLDDPRLVGSLH